MTVRTVISKFVVMFGIQRLMIFVQRIQHKNKIFSFGISMRALSGNHINIGSGTEIDGLTTIGSYTYIGRNCTITRTKIGRYVSIGNNVTIGPGEHDLGRLSTSSLFYESPYNELTQRQCIIENDAWIGVDAIIMRGIRVGIGAAVGANAVVTKDVPDYAVVAGVPAKILKYRFEDKKQALLLASQWWTKNLKEASDILEQIAKAQL